MKSNRGEKHWPVLKPGVKTAIRWIAFMILGVAFYCTSTSGAAKPKALLLFPLTLAVAAFESEIPSAAFGAVFGVLLDVSLGKLPGFTGLCLCLGCTLCSTLFAQLLRKNLINFMWVFTLVGGIYLYIDYYFYYKIWAYDGYQLVLTKKLIPSALKTLVWAMPVFGLVWLIKRLTGSTRQPQLEEQDEKIDRV